MSRLVYQASARLFSHHLKNLSAILKAAEKDAKARGIEESVLMGARLAPDMFPLTHQVMIASDNAKGCCARLTGTTAPVFSDDNASFAELQERIRGTLAFIRTLKVADFEGAEHREIEMETPVGKLYFSGADYLNGWALPNFYFHYTTAYAILRHNGLNIGKPDYLGKVPGLEATGQIAKMMGLKPRKAPRKKAPKKK